MIAVHFDVITLIISKVDVDDRRTLFSLLAVNKEIFRHTCKILYRDPFRFFRTHDRDDNLTKSMEPLLRLFLSISPLVDEETNYVRALFGLPMKHESEAETAPTTMLDYLSFVQYIRLENDLHPLPVSRSVTGLQYPIRPKSQSILEGSLIRSTVTWCIVGHRLDQVYELEVEPGDIERYIALAPKLCRLRTLVIAAFYCGRYDVPPHTFDSTARLVQAIHQHHGKDRLHDCRLSHRTKYAAHPKTFQWEVDIRKQLPPILPPDLKLVLPLRTMDSYLSRVTVLEMQKGSPYYWDKLLKEYADMSVSQLLQRCRALVRLDYFFPKIELFDPDVLAWAVDEARERKAGRLLAPAVLMEHLHLSLSAPAADAIKVLMDGIRGFAPSLRTLDVVISPRTLPRPGMPKQRKMIPRLPVGDEALFMRRLERLTYICPGPMLFNHRLVQLCPLLTQLVVYMEQYSDSLASHRTWPVFDLPSLTSLELTGSAMQLFDPASLRGMPKLKSMSLCTVENGETPHRYYTKALDRWTWDWYLPELTKLVVSMRPWEANFTFGVLRCFPKLQRLNFQLPSSTDVPRYPLDVLSVLPIPNQDIFPNLTSLALWWRYSLQPKDLQVLLGRVLPGLEWLTVNDMSSCTLQQVIEATRHHSSLSYVQIGQPAPDDAMQQMLGLEAITLNTRHRGRRYLFNPRGRGPTTFRLKIEPNNVACERKDSVC